MLQTIMCGKRCCACAGILENGITMPWLNAQAAFITYESHVLFALRFMVDCNVVGGGWVELPAGSYEVRHQLHQRQSSQVSALSCCFAPVK